MRVSQPGSQCFPLTILCSEQSRLIWSIRKMYLVLYPLCDKGQPIGPQITENWREEDGGWTQIGVGSGYECASSLHESQNSGSCLLRWAPQTRLSQSRLDCAVYSAHQHLPRTQQIFTVSPEEAHNVSCCI